VEKRLFVVKSKNDLERCYPVMKELRPHLSFADYLSIYDQSHASDGYEIVAIEDGGRIVAVMGYRFLSDFVRGKHGYVDDLVSTESARSKGLGAELLQFAEDVAASWAARACGCAPVLKTRTESASTIATVGPSAPLLTPRD